MKTTRSGERASTRGAPALPTPAQLRVLSALVTTAAEGGDAVTVARLAGPVGVHPNAVRRHLGALARGGWVAVARAAGRPGRPAVTYEPTPLGLAALSRSGERAGPGAGAEGVSGAEYLDLANAFAERLAAQADGVDQAREIGRSWGGELGRREGGADLTGERPERRVVALLTRLGFAPRALADGRGRPAGGSWRLEACPLLAAARRTPDIVCAVHLGLVEGASAAYGGPTTGASLTAFADPDGCLLRLPAGGGTRSAAGQSVPRR